MATEIYTRHLIVMTIILFLWHNTADAAGARSKREDETYTATTIEEMPYLSKKGDDFEGFLPDMIVAIEDIMSAKFEFKLVADKRYGQKTSSGSWNGMIGEVMNDNADVAVAPMTISDKRKEAVDFTKPFMSFNTIALMKKTASITEVRQLAQQTAIQYGMVRDGSTADFFKGSSDKDFEKMWKNIEDNNNLLTSIKEGTDRVKRENGTFAFIMESISAKYWTNEKPCDLEVVGEEELRKGEYAFATKKGSDLTDKLSDAITQLKDNGKMEELEKKWWHTDCSAGAPGLVVSHFALIATALLLLIWR